MFKKGHKGFKRKNANLTFCFTCGVDLEEHDAIVGKDGKEYCSDDCRKFSEE